MKARVIWAGAVLAIAALVLAACGEAICSQRVNTSPGTEGVGPVSIASDHSVYAPGDVIRATITNHLSTRIAVNNDNFTEACPYFALQMRAGNDWQDVPACTPSPGDMHPSNDQQLIAAGGSFTSAVRIHTDLSAGTYRLWIASYIIDDAQGRVAGEGTAESVTIRVCACRVCA